MSVRRRHRNRHVDAVAENAPLPEAPDEGIEPEYLDDLRTAIELSGSRPSADLPSNAFVARLRHQINAESQGVGADENRPLRVVSRRRLIVGAGTIAAGVAGVIADRTLSAPRPNQPQQRASQQRASQHRASQNRASQNRGSEILQPDTGAWVPVSLSDTEGGGGPRRFATSSVAGFVTEQGGQLVAVSGICTHLGCELRANPAAGRLDCPCHRTAFGYDGKVLYSRLPEAPAPLPRIQVRQRDTSVEVFVPPS